MRRARKLTSGRGVCAGIASVWLFVGCVSPREAALRDGPLRISDITHLGDARRRASTQLIVEGLDVEIGDPSRRSHSRYERAIQIDPGNPFAYLALARHYASNNDPEHALEHLDRARALLDAESAESPRVEPHLIGLRGAALRQTGSREAKLLLDRARQLAPTVWSDGRLTARELR